jgi:hypothetical protein
MPAELALVLDPATGDPDLDPAAVQIAPAARVVVALVGVELLGPASGPTGVVAPTTDAGVGLQQWLEQLGVVGVRRRDEDVQRKTVGVDE